ncbi:MAG: cupin domain-containing protein [Acidobacteria bacterium]|nr:cupin domain-containing protein [Acidobacteriota bacterium]
MHYVRRSANTVLGPPPLYTGHSTGYTHASLVDHTSGSVHTGLSLNSLEAGGTIAPHVHSYEEGFYVLEGQPLVSIESQTYRLKPGDFGAVKVGMLHAWRNTGSGPGRWLQMAAPQPKPAGRERDTFFARSARLPSAAEAHDVDGSDPTPPALLGHFDVGQIPPPGEGRTGAGTLPGVFLKWMIDEQFGARHHRMLLIEYQPGVSIGLHDHTFEEAYYILTGAVQATLDGERYLVEAGDVVWTGVGCVHAFANVGSVPVQWLETFSPQPPAENVFRFMAEWEQRARDIEG